MPVTLTRRITPPGSLLVTNGVIKGYYYIKDVRGVGVIRVIPVILLRESDFAPLIFASFTAEILLCLANKADLRSVATWSTPA